MAGVRLMRRTTSVRQQNVIVSLAVSVAAALLVLGPVLASGVVLAYDMAWAPDPRLTPFTLGVGTPAPRAVPSDAAAVLLGKIVGAERAQALTLMMILVGLGVGSARLLTTAYGQTSPLAASASAVVAIWNPFVYERLVVGQWGILLGAAVLPWAVDAALRNAALVCSGWIAVASLGGGNAVLIAVLPALGVLLMRRYWRSALLGSVVCVGASAVWALPALLAGVTSTDVGARAFAARADSPAGLLPSLLAGGGVWNVAAHAEVRQSMLIAILSAALGLAAGAMATTRARRGRPVVLVGILGLVLTWASGWHLTASLWESMTVQLPGGGLLRDSHKLIAWWLVLVSLGTGIIVERSLRLRASPAIGSAVSGLVLLAPVALLPTLAWGVAGRLAPVEVPKGLLESTATLSTAPDGLVGLLPWSQYRRYAWNDDRVSLTLGPRLIDQSVLFNDALPTTAGTVPGEDPRAERVSRAVENGTGIVDALLAEGVRYVAVERNAGLPEDDVDSVGPVIIDTPELLVRQVASPLPRPPSPRTPITAGWIISITTWLLVGAVSCWCAVERARSRLIT